MFSPVVAWNATHHWASFAFQGDRAAAGARFHPLGPLVVLGGEALFVLPWIWAPMMALFVAALRRGPDAWRSWLLACLAAPPIVLFALIAAWSSQRVLFHWAAPGYLMLFPLLGEAVATRLPHPWLRRTLAGTAAFVVLTVAVVATQVRFDWLHPVIARVARQDPDLEAIDWTSLRTGLAARGLLAAGTVVGVPDWRDAGKIAYALGPDVTVLCLNRDARQFGLANPPAALHRPGRAAAGARTRGAGSAGPGPGVRRHRRAAAGADPPRRAGAGGGRGAARPPAARVAAAVKPMAHLQPTYQLVAETDRSGRRPNRPREWHHYLQGY